MAIGMGENLFAPGDVCGNHEIVRLLGAGGFAQVYEVVDSGGDRRALKIIAASPGIEPKLHARLAQEGAALSMIEHVNVVRLYGAGLHGAHVWLLLELIEGRSLRERLGADGVRPSLETVVRWARQACEGVAEAHRVGVVHRDLKPENILVTPSDLVKVIDFGIAKLGAWGVKTTHEQRVGTALYMSPEQVHGRPPDPRMDVYAMGIILYEALAHVHPIVPGPASIFDVCVRQLVFRPEPLAKTAPHVPADLAAVVDRAIEKDPNARFPSMRAMSAALHQALLSLTAERRAAVEHILPANAILPEGLPSVGPLAMTQPRLPCLAEPVPDLAYGTQGSSGAPDTRGVKAAARKREASGSPVVNKTRQRWGPGRVLVTTIAFTTAVATWCIFDASGWSNRRHSLEATAVATTSAHPAVPPTVATAGDVRPAIRGASDADAIAPTPWVGPAAPSRLVPSPRSRPPTSEHVGRAGASAREQPFPVAEDEPGR
jgi:serine/threonine-protein kinase